MLAAGGQMGALLAERDWTGTPLGPVQMWPQSLISAASICLQSRFPMIIFWGPEFVQLYNDAYTPILGAKHPESVGQPAGACWAELWPVIGPMLDGVLRRGDATFSADLLLLMDRHDYTEETYFTFSYSPIVDESGGIGGVFCAVCETTERVVGERRLATLRELAAGTVKATSPEHACRAAVSALAGNPDDLPFVTIYLPDDDTGELRRVAASDLVEAEPAELVGPGPDSTGALAEVMRSGRPVLIDRLDGIAPATAAVTAERALALPISQPTGEHPAGVIVVGVSPRRYLDDGYRGFFDLVAGQVATAVADARAYADERRRAEALTQLDRAKTAFFSNVSHEFRTPLTLLLGPLEDALADPDADPGVQRDRVALAHRNARRLLKLVNTLLEFSRTEAGRAVARFEPVELSGYTSQLAGVFRSAVERAGMALVVDCPPLDQPVRVDRDMWEKIVLNLLSNAFKHTFSGSITVQLSIADDVVRLTVRDTGVGIPVASLPHLFERFHRVDGARARTHEGSGIGLSLVHDLVELHGGTVEVSSTEEVGTTFTVSLPLGGPPAAPSTPDGHTTAGPPATRGVDAAFYGQEALGWIADEAPAADLATEESPADEAYAGPDPDGSAQERRPTVLVADDNADLRDHLRRVLGAHWRVILVGNGARALRVARSRPVDLVVTDVMMPELDGFGLLRALRADPVTRSLPVIMLSARAGQEATIDGLDAGADDYLVKPFTARELVARVRAQLGLAELRNQAVRQVRSLAHASHALSTSLDTQELVNLLTTVVVPEWADECAVWLLRPGRAGDRDLVPMLATGPAARPAGRLAELIAADPAGVGTAVGVDQVVTTARPRDGRLADSVRTLTLSLHHDSRRLGALTVSRGVRRTWRPADIEYLTDLARRLATALDNAGRYEAERNVALTLQHSLLPAELPDLPGIRLAARYRPGGRGAGVGGDWYDAFPQPNGTISVAIGDVMGRGVRAAAIMGQLRSALRGYALEDLSPAQLLTRLDAFVDASGEPHLSTCQYGVYDQASRRLRIASAGHLPPLLVDAEGRARYLELPAGLPLGVGAIDGFTFVDSEIVLDPGSLLLMFTDGLVEDRGRSLDDGLRQLEKAMNRPPASPEESCELALETVVGEGEDDTTLLAVVIE